jgi:hypothetical protein
MKDWRKIQRELLKKKNVVAVGLGFKEVDGCMTGRRAIVCSVEKKEPLSALAVKDLIPANIEGDVTDVFVSGKIKALKLRIDRWRPAPGGVSIGHEWISAGTLGCLVKRGNEIFILSNNHVLADSNNAPLGSPILQPGKYDGGTLIDRIALLEDFVPIEFVGGPSGCKIGNAITRIFNAPATVAKRQTRLQAVNSEQLENLVDAAIARPIDTAAVLKEILEIGVPLGLEIGSLGMKIQKSGRTTGLTKGEITQVDVMVTVQYGEGKTALFVDQIMAGEMCSGGDSGSAVLNMDKELVGLLFAGSDKTTVMNPILDVFERLGVTLF